jgi:polysaccharide deacetylase family protein (PEP-CTERM system associated)
MTIDPAALPNALTVDVEDYFHVRNLAPYIAREAWNGFTETIPAAVPRLLELFAAHGARASFFVLGWVAQRHPELVRAIDAGGHEVACHGFAHQPVNRLSPQEFRADLRAAKQAIEDAVGKPVRGYRAPSFSIDQSNLWAFDALIEEGFAYDSSLFPGRTVPIGFLGADREPCVIRRAGGRIVELPLTRLDLFGRSLPFAGGGFFRFYPYPLIRAGLRRIRQTHRAPAVIYLHPWEIAPDQPRIAADWRARFKHYVGLRGFERKLGRLLADFPFGGSVKSFVSRAGAR